MVKSLEIQRSQTFLMKSVFLIYVSMATLLTKNENFKSDTYKLHLIDSCFFLCVV